MSSWEMDSPRLSPSNTDPSYLLDESDQEQEIDPHELELQLEKELLALRSMRDEELFGPESHVTTDDHSGGGMSGSDEDEFESFLQYKPRCQFRPNTARKQSHQPNPSNQDGPYHQTQDHTVAASSSLVSPIASEPLDFDFTIDGISNSNAPMTIENGSGTNRRPGTASQRTTSSRPSTASSRSRQPSLKSSNENEEKTFDPTTSDQINQKLGIPPLPIFTPVEQAEYDGTDAFIQTFQHDMDELNSLISSAPAPSQTQQELLQQGVDISSWSRAKREEVAKQTLEAQLKIDADHAAFLRRLQEEAARQQALNGPRPDANGILPEDSPNPPAATTSNSSNSNNESKDESKTNAASPLPPLLSSPTPLPPTSTVFSPPPHPPSTPLQPLPPLIPSTLPSMDKLLARSLARDQAFASYVEEESAAKLKKSVAIETSTREALDQSKKEEAYRAAVQASWMKREEKRLQEIKAKKAQRAQELQEKEQARKRIAEGVRERQAMRHEDEAAKQRMDAAKRKEERARQQRASELQQREITGMKLEDQRASKIYEKKQAIKREEQRLEQERLERERRVREQRLEEERRERERLEAVRLEALRVRQEQEAKQAAEYARQKKEEARIQAEKAAAEQARLDALEAERKKYELEQLRMKEALLRQRLEAERLEQERKAAEAERQRKEAEEAERKQQEAIARELARRAQEEAERKAYFEKMRLEKEEQARKEAERQRLEAEHIQKEKEEAEARARQAELERKAREKLHKKQSKAVRKIQRLWRGYRVRSKDPLCQRLTAMKLKRAEQRFHAAQRIQALMRGWLIRHKLHRIRAHARVLDTDDLDDEFDYGGIDPSFYTIESIPEFDMKLPEEAKKMLKNAGGGGSSKPDLRSHKDSRSGSIDLPQMHQPRSQDPPPSSSHAARTNHITDERIRVHSAGVASKLSSSGRGGLVSAAHESSAANYLPPQLQGNNMRVNNFFGSGSNPTAQSQPTPAYPIEPTKFPRLPTPTSSSGNGASFSQPRISTAQSDASDVSHRSADRSSRPEGPATHMGGGSKAAKLAELSAAWGVSDPRTLEAMLRKKQKMAKMKAKKSNSQLSADERLEKFQRATGNGGGGSSGSYGLSMSGQGTGGEKKKKKRSKGVPSAWLIGGASKSMPVDNDVDDGESDDGVSEDDEGDESPQTTNGPYPTQYRVPVSTTTASSTNLFPLNLHSSTSSSTFNPLSPNYLTSPSSSRGPSVGNVLLNPTKPAIHLVQPKRR